MKIVVEIEGEEVASVKPSRSTAPAEILEKAAALGAEDAGPAPALIFGKGPSPFALETREAAFAREVAIDCGKAPKEFQSDIESEMRGLASSIEAPEAKDAGKAALK